jgi:RNA polymerase sigma factor (TIGR02999 family)
MAAEPTPSGEITALLLAWREGQPGALDRLLLLVYDDLRRQARRQLRRERSDHTLQPTALVHEAFLRLGGQGAARWQNRRQFFAVASQAMRRVLVDHARAHGAAKRGDGRTRVSLEEWSAAGAAPQVDVLALDQALERLERIDPRQARVVELRYFGGLSAPEAAEVLEVSLATVNRDWAMARAWLFRELGGAR